jgi:stearoyl-CoA desaturase (delta-9 desaturase)
MSAIERRITVTAVVLPFVAFCVAIVLLWGGLVTALDLGIFAVMYAAVGLGVTVGFHRLLTHRSFEAPTWVRCLLAILGSMSVQGAVIHWVADHRKHHTYADEDGDPHSPHTEPGSGVFGILRGIWHSHMGWLFDRNDRASARRYSPDLRSDPAISFVDRWFLVWVLLGLALPALAGFALSGGSAKAAATALLWGGFVRVFFLHHATWSVNSICHLYGRRPFALDDESRNNWAIALVSLGEGWHHNHHAFPTSARHGLKRLQFDPTYAVIRLFELVGLARNVRRPSSKQIASKLKTPQRLSLDETTQTAFAKAPHGT